MISMDAESKTLTPSQQVLPSVKGEKTSSLTQEYDRWQRLLIAQPVVTQSCLNKEAHNLAEALIKPATQAYFVLPERVVLSIGDNQQAPVPSGHRQQVVGRRVNRLMFTELYVALSQRLDELERASDSAVATAAGLLRFVTATALVYDLLPDGHIVYHPAAKGDESPAGLAGSLQTGGLEDCPSFMPQWVAFDETDRLLVSSVEVARARLASMQRFIRILRMAVALAPYEVVNEQYLRKLYGMLGQLVNQGQAMARFLTREMITIIQCRAAANNLNRGLRLSLPYFDDQALEMKSQDFEVIPPGRILFAPAFVVLAVRKEQACVGLDTHINRSTRRHLLDELQMLETAFSPT
jgi:hypothetical protein